MTNDNSPPLEVKQKFAIVLSETIGMFMDLGMSTFEMVPIVEAELEKLRRPFQNPKDN